VFLEKAIQNRFELFHWFVSKVMIVEEAYWLTLVENYVAT